MNLIRVIPAKGSGQNNEFRIASVVPTSRPLTLPRRASGLFLWETTGMEIVINGHLETCPPGTLAELVAGRGLTPETLVVELNGTIVRQGQWPAIRLEDNDVLELLSFVGGG